MSWRSEPLKIWPRNYWNWSSTGILPVSVIRSIQSVGATSHCDFYAFNRNGEGPKRGTKKNHVPGLPRSCFRGI